MIQNAMNALDLAYGFGLAASAPYWGLRPAARRKVFSALKQRMGDVPTRSDDRPAVMIHAVSLGEINATRSLVTQLTRRRPNLRFIISTTTETGFAQGQKLYANNSDITLIRYPLDFSLAVNRVLDRQRPSAVVLMELELWPNFMAQCRRRKIPMVLVNGRITPRSYGRYRWIAPVTKKMFGALSATCAQDQEYAERFISLGSNPQTTHVTGTMKFDTAEITERVAGDADLAMSLQLDRADPLWVCGSTGPGEEEICLDVHHRLLKDFPNLRLAIVPRKPERFDEVARLIAARGFKLLRRSSSTVEIMNRPVILGDTMGELRKFYSLANVVFVGRTLIDQGQRQRGSDMIEPAALGKPTVVGPFTDNFREVMNAFRQSNSMIEVHSADELFAATAKLLREPGDIGKRAQRVVAAQQGATAKHADIVFGLIQ
ncbi:MAG TPA: 3-deoxy-D-manno-octulosonic acid transferase [Tepidisphaeraceae bacterium]|nr:3-deoxy-D-manno-octulosonic acid transferase [Tepidisphaeraceae bacterium]